MTTSRSRLPTVEESTIAQARELLFQRTRNALSERLPAKVRRCRFESFERERLERLERWREIEAWNASELEPGEGAFPAFAYLWSPTTGSGKTHLAVAMLRNVVGRRLAAAAYSGNGLRLFFERQPDGFLPFTFAFEIAPDMLERMKSEFDQEGPRVVYSSATTVPVLGAI